MPGLPTAIEIGDAGAVVVVNGERDDDVGRRMERIGRPQVAVLHFGRAGGVRRGVAGVARSR